MRWALSQEGLLQGRGETYERFLPNFEKSILKYFECQELIDDVLWEGVVERETGGRVGWDVQCRL